MPDMLPLAQLDPAEVLQATQEIATRVQEENPRLNATSGVMAKIVVGFHAMLETQQRRLLDSYLAGRSLKAIEADPTAAEDDLVDDVLSNYLLTRKAGTLATGEVAIVMTTDVTVTVAEGAAFQIDGRTYVTASVYVAKAEASQIFSETDRLFVKNADGRYVFTVPVQSSAVGDGYQVRKGTLAVPSQFPTGFVTAYAAADFTPGLDAETNAELISRLRQGIAARGGSNRDNLDAMLRERDEFSRIVRTSTIGMGRAEMLRDKHWIFPVGGGGRIDWYVRTQEASVSQTFPIAATCLGSGNWQAAIGRDVLPGFFEIVSVRPAGSDDLGSLTIVDEERGWNVEDVDTPPDLTTVAEAAYSRFQTAIVQFYDPATTATAVGTTADYDFTLRGLPQIGDVQDYVLSSDVRHQAADILVKAPVPCFAKIGVTIHKRATDADPDLAAIRAAVRQTVHGIGFVGKLYASQIYDAIAGNLNQAVVSALDMIGRIRYPSGRSKTLRSATLLEIPDAPADMVSARTLQFFIDDADILISVVNAIPST